MNISAILKANKIEIEYELKSRLQRLHTSKQTEDSLEDGLEMFENDFTDRERIHK